MIGTDVPPGPETLSILTVSDGKTLAKTFTQTNDPQPLEKGYDNAARFTGSIATVSNIHELAQLLADLATDSRSCVILGDFRPDAQLRRNVNRRMNPDPKRPHVKPDIVPSSTGKKALPLDIEKVPMPHSDAVEVTHDKVVGINDPAGAVRSVIREYLPPYFHGVTAFYAFSSSAGVKGWNEVRLRLWYYMSEPVKSIRLATWAKRIKALDPAIYTPNQVIYTATPIFKNMPDPCDNWRVGVIHGD